MMQIEPTGQACGAVVTGVDLAGPLAAETVAAIRAAWLQHHVLAFPDQRLSDDDLDRFTLAMGGFGEDPFIAPIAGRQHIIAVARAADETAPIFAETWHTDWSFQARPPAGTCLYGITIPPIGGDTLFSNQHLALDAMPAELRARIEGLTAIHSAQKAYAAWTSALRKRPAPPSAIPSSAITPKPAAKACSAAWAMSSVLKAWPTKKRCRCWSSCITGKGRSASSIATAGSRTCW
jgi:alpha-ketoglutarate-dependent taurine dioxygenase